MSMKNKLFALIIVVIVCVSGCSKNVAPGDYASSEVGKVKKVIPGTIVSARPVRLHNQNPASGQNLVDSEMTRSHGYEYVIRLNSGSIISVVQTDDTKLNPKQHVLIIYGKNTRVVPDDGGNDL